MLFQDAASANAILSVAGTELFCLYPDIVLIHAEASSEREPEIQSLCWPPIQRQTWSRDYASNHTRSHVVFLAFPAAFGLSEFSGC